MAYKELALQALSVNSANDRHGELENETAAIAWLFTNHESAMRKLAKDLAETGEIYEPPLVWPDGATYVVFDGNRRVTCLKLIAQPKRAPIQGHRMRFATVDLAASKNDIRARLTELAQTSGPRAGAVAGSASSPIGLA